ncbi:hypothetical protein ACQZV8_19900 [Magnetococcales bacterium HHB-1]
MPVNLYTALLILAWCHLLMGPILIHTQVFSFTESLSQLFGISSLIWMALTLSILLIHQDQKNQTITRTDKKIVYYFLLIPLFLVPSTLFIGLMMLCIGLWHLFKHPPTRPLSLLIIITISAFLSTTESGRLFFSPLAILDSLLVEHLLHLFNIPINRSGTFLTTAQDSKLLILSGCASYENLLATFSGWFALTLWHHQGKWPSSFHNAYLLMFLVLILNTGRLAMMATDPQWQITLHQPPASTFFSLTLLLLTWTLAQKPQTSTPPHIKTTTGIKYPTSNRMLISTMLLLSIGALLPKIERYSNPPKQEMDRSHQQLEQRLQQKDWLPVENIPLTRNKMFQTTAYISPHCPGRLYLMPWSASIESKDLFTGAGIDTTYSRYIYQNRLYTSLPWLQQRLDQSKQILWPKKSASDYSVIFFAVTTHDCWPSFH